MKPSALVAVVITAVGCCTAVYFGVHALTKVDKPAVHEPPMDGMATTDFEFPEAYAEAEPKLVPIVRNRVGQENARMIMATDPLADLPAAVPHKDLGGGLWGEVALETPDRFIRVPANEWKKWNVDFDTAFAKAVTTMDKKTRARLQMSKQGFYTGLSNNENATALLLLPIFDGLGLEGAPVFATPRPNVLLIADSSSSDALEELKTRLDAACEADENDNCDLRVRTKNQAGSFVPYAAGTFATVAHHADAAEASGQKNFLEQKLGKGDDAPFIASVSVVRKGDDEFSYAVHTQGVRTLLPRAEYIAFMHFDERTQKTTPVAMGAFARVEAIMGSRWRKTQLFPERWLVSEFPSDEELKRIGFEKLKP